MIRTPTPRTSPRPQAHRPPAAVSATPSPCRSLATPSRPSPAGASSRATIALPSIRADLPAVPRFESDNSLNGERTLPAARALFPAAFVRAAPAPHQAPPVLRGPAPAPAVTVQAQTRILHPPADSYPAVPTTAVCAPCGPSLRLRRRGAQPHSPLPSASRRRAHQRPRGSAFAYEAHSVAAAMNTRHENLFVYDPHIHLAAADAHAQAYYPRPIAAHTKGFASMRASIPSGAPAAAGAAGAWGENGDGGDGEGAGYPCVVVAAARACAQHTRARSDASAGAAAAAAWLDDGEREAEDAGYADDLMMWEASIDASVDDTSEDTDETETLHEYENADAYSALLRNEDGCAGYDDEDAHARRFAGMCGVYVYPFEAGLAFGAGFGVGAAPPASLQ
ncbi:hypothetical protein DFH09DRAFT_1320282 [Mycena vulgaris]|nr:hypothetical protein DFH09DRAFT_1320282 [Mycena vulgaris]